MEIRPLYFADEIFYLARIGKQATVLEVQCTLAQEVIPEALEAAFANALRVHTNFRIRPVVVHGRFQAMVDDVKKPPVFKKDGRVRQLGTAETDGLMIYVVYDEKVITLHIFHGLSDFRGIIAFLKTILKFYYHETGQAETVLPEPDSADTIPCMEDIVKAGAPGDPIGMFNPDKDKVFHLPEENFGKKTTMQQICEIDVPLEPILALSKRNESSVVPTLQAFIGRAIRKTYDVGEKVIIGYTPVDLRPIFHFETSGNASSNFTIPYTEMMDRHDLAERAMFLRTILDLQIQPENLYARVKGTMDRVIPVAESPLPVGIETKLMLNVGRKEDTANYTYGISYAGKVLFGDEIDPYVTSVTACAGSYSYPLWILACEFNGILRMVFTQSYESNRLAKNIYQELASEIPGTTFADRGHHEFDEFRLINLWHTRIQKERKRLGF